MLSGWTRSFALAVALAGGSDVRPTTFSWNASASARVRSGRAHLGHPGAVHAYGQRGLIRACLRRTYLRDDGVTAPLALRRRADGSDAITLVYAVYHEISPLRRMPHG